MAYGSKQREEFDPTNRGTLNKNENRSEDWHPEYKGSLNVDGREYWIDAKLRDGRHGKFMSLKVRPKQEQRRDDYERGRQDAASSRNDPDDEIPF